MPKLCFPAPFPKFCIPLYTPIERFPGDPDPWPWKGFSQEEILRHNDHLKDLIGSGLVKKETIVELVSLSMIYQISNGLNSGLRENLQSTIKGHVEKLGNEANVNFKV